jgi:hypothetical protein
MSTTANKQLNKPTYNQTSPTWDIPLNANADILDAALGSTTSIPLTNANVTLSSTQCQNMRILLTGTISANIIITFPAEGGFWIVSNFTAGSYTITAASAGGGNAVVINQGFSVVVFSDGTNMYFANDGLTSTAGAANGIFYLNSQEVTASYTIPSNQNAMTAGPISIDAGVTITVQAPSTWTII